MLNVSNEYKRHYGTYPTYDSEVGRQSAKEAEW
jgi:hypothetical protein